MYLTVAEVADRLRLAEKTVRVMACRGEIRAIRLAGPRSSIRIPVDAIAEWEATRLPASA